MHPHAIAGSGENQHVSAVEHDVVVPGGVRVRDRDRRNSTFQGNPGKSAWGVLRCGRQEVDPPTVERELESADPFGTLHLFEAVAIDAPPFKGVSELPLPMVKSNRPVLRNLLNYKRVVALTEPQFRTGFASAVSEREARELYSRYAIPGPAKPLP